MNAPDRPPSRWGADPSVPRGADYDARFERLARQGVHLHGEADLVESLTEGPRVLDAGCGTGRVALELAARGLDVTGVDLDPAMLDAARAKAPTIAWHEADLAELDLGEAFDTIVLAGNVLIFVHPGTEPRVLERCAAHLHPGGLLIAGFSTGPGRYGPNQLDADAAAAGLVLEHRWSTWERAPFEPDGDYQVSVHRRR